MSTSIKYFLIALLVGILDRLVKFFVSDFPSIDLFFVKVQQPELNTAFSLSLPLDNLLALILSSLAIVILIILFSKIKLNERPYFAIIIGAALSNLFDRIFFGGVIDYINFLNISVINLADIAITLSLLVIVYKRLRT